MFEGKWEELLARAEAGDLAARKSLRREIEAQMVRTTRRTVRWGVASSPLERRILLTADRVRAWRENTFSGRHRNHLMEDREMFVRRIAEAISEEVCDRIEKNFGCCRDVLETLLGGKWPETTVASCAELSMPKSTRP